MWLFIFMWIMYDNNYVYCLCYMSHFIVNNHFSFISYVNIHIIRWIAVTANVICLPTISNSNKVLSYLILSYVYIARTIFIWNLCTDEEGWSTLPKKGNGCTFNKLNVDGVSDWKNSNTSEFNFSEAYILPLIYTCSNADNFEVWNVLECSCKYIEG